MNIPGNSFGELVQFIEGKGQRTYVPGEAARDSRARLVWLCTIGQASGVSRYVICILRAVEWEGTGTL